MTETELADAIIRHALELQALANHDEALAEAELRALADDLKQLMRRGNLSQASKREMAAIIKAANDAIAGRYINIAGVVDMEGVIELVSQRTLSVISQAAPAVLSASRLASLAKDVLIEGAPSAAWWSKQADDLQFKFAGIVRRGVINGETNEQIVARVAGRWVEDEDGLRFYEPGLFGRHISRNGKVTEAKTYKDARALVHTSIMTAANRARLESYREGFGKNAKGIRWLATLDSHTCVTCAALDGSEWDFDGKPLNGTRLDFQAPPAHWNCRCVASPVIAGTLDEIFGVKGLDARLNAPSVRASSQGPVEAMNFGAFLKRQSPDFIEDVLGTRRAELYQRGKLTLTELVTKSGRQKTLAELRAN